MSKSELEERFNFQAKALGLGPFEVQYKFHPSRRWKLDAAWPEIHVAVEIDGGTWSGGRHTTGTGFAKDCEKLNEAIILGWAVLRGDTNMVKNGKLAEYAERLVKERRNER